MKKYDKEAVRSAVDKESYYRSELPDLKMLTAEQAKCLCIFHEEKTPSLTVNFQTGRFHCFGCGKDGDIFKFRELRHGEDFPAALKYFAELTGTTPPKAESSKPKKITAIYDYKDETGRLLFQAVRHEPKTFSQRQPNGKGGFIYNLHGVRLVPYNLQAVLKADTVHIVEGEKDADALNAMGLVGTTSPMGAGKWKAAYNEHFKGKDVVILPDNDEPGEKHAQAVALSLNGTAKTIKIISLPDLPHKGDVSDWIKAGGTKEQLFELIEGGQEWKQPEAQEPEAPEERESGLVRLDMVTPEEVEWFWYPYIPMGKITMIDGDPGNGKSVLTVDLAARTTTAGIMPDGTQGVQGGVVILALEDGLADTIVPRLRAAGGDTSKVMAIRGTPDITGTLRYTTIQDVDQITKACEAVNAKLVIIDPIMAHLGDANSFKDQDVRQAMAPLVKMADENKLAVVIVRHLNKAQGGSSMYRGGGSIGFNGLARVCLLVAKDPENESRRILAGIKSNLAPLPSSLSYEIENCQGVPRVSWGGTCDHTADELLAIPSSPEEKSALDEAKDFLLDILKDGASINTKEILKQSKNSGIADRTLKRAKSALKVKAEKLAFSDGWVWRLNPEECQTTPNLASFEEGQTRTEEGQKTLYTGTWHPSRILAPFAGNAQSPSETDEVLDLTGVIDAL